MSKADHVGSYLSQDSAGADVTLTSPERRRHVWGVRVVDFQNRFRALLGCC